MDRYFFDVVRPERSEFDYVGRMLPTMEEAYEAAEMMAFDVAVKRADEMIGSDVKVSTADGHKLFSIPVQESYVTAMPSDWGVSSIAVNCTRNATVTEDALGKVRFSPKGETHKMAA
jgi:hypothetical protein